MQFGGLPPARGERFSCKHFVGAEEAEEIPFVRSRRARFYIVSAVAKQARANQILFTIRPGAPQLKDLEGAIDKAKRLLEIDLEEQELPPIRPGTWERMARFLRSYNDWLQATRDQSLPVPKIHPGPPAAIELHWKHPKWELLMTIPEDKASPITFYWDDYGSTKMKGSFADESFSVAMLPWLVPQ